VISIARAGESSDVIWSRRTIVLGVRQFVAGFCPSVGKDENKLVMKLQKQKEKCKCRITVHKIHSKQEQARET